MLKKSRFYSYYNTNTQRMDKYRVDYTLYYSGGILVEIRNELGFAIEKNSECWDHFKSKI